MTTYTGNTSEYSYEVHNGHVVSVDDWGSQNYTMNITDDQNWSVDYIASTTDGGSPESYPHVSIGWQNNQTLMNALSTDTAKTNYTTASGLGLQVSSMPAFTLRWAFSVPQNQNLNNTVTRNDELIDIYYHTEQLPPASEFPPLIDLQIMQSLNDQPLGGQAAATSGWYADVAVNSGVMFLKTLGGVPYAGVIDIFGPFNQTGGHTITLFVRPTMMTDSATCGLLWGKQDVTHDIQAISAWLSSSNPTDDSGAAIKYGSAKTVVTTPIIPPACYLTSINAGFEVNFASTGNTHFANLAFVPTIGESSVMANEYTTITLASLPTTRTDGSTLAAANLGAANVYKNGVKYASINAPLAVNETWKDTVAAVNGDKYTVSVLDTQSPAVESAQSTAYTVSGIVTVLAAPAAPSVTGKTA